jgi:ketosteroid isomerase-like protein
MTMTTSDSPEVGLLHRAWEAMRRGDFAVLEDALAQDAKWRTVDKGPTNCEGRSTILEVMSRKLESWSDRQYGSALAGLAGS